MVDPITRRRRRRRRPASAPDYTTLDEFVRELQQDPHLLHTVRDTLALRLEPAAPAIMQMRRLGMSLPAIATVLRHKANIIIKPAYLGAWLHKQRDTDASNVPALRAE